MSESDPIPIDEFPAPFLRAARRVADSHDMGAIAELSLRWRFSGYSLPEIVASLRSPRVREAMTQAQRDRLDAAITWLLTDHPHVPSRWDS